MKDLAFLNIVLVVCISMDSNQRPSRNMLGHGMYAYYACMYNSEVLDKYNAVDGSV